MASLKIQAPDGKTLSINVPEGTDPSQYDAIVDDVMKDYTSQENPSKLGSFGRGVLSGIPGAEAAQAGIESAFTPKTYEEAHQGIEDARTKDWETNPVSYGAGKAT